MGGGCNSRKVAKVTLWIAVPVLIFSLVMMVVFNRIYNARLKKDITLGEGTLSTEIWEDIPLPIYEKLYFFNITNEEKFLSGSEPLNVTEVGPYTYKSRWVKKGSLEWYPNNTVSYRENRTYHFVPDLSNGSEDDLIYTLNGPMIIASDIAGKIGNAIEREAACLALTGLLKLFGETLVIQKSVRELAYDGYDDFIISKTKFIKKDIPYKNGKFSWLYGKNDTDDGLFTVFTGEGDASKTNFINRWNGEERLSFWKGNSENETSTCNMLKGTSIETGPPIEGEQDTYSFFQSIFCRSLTFNYTEDVSHYGIRSKRFKSTYGIFANSTENPNNECFEIKKERASGILDVSPCQFGAPVYMSFPHFHFADPTYLNSVNGLKPNDSEHGSYIDVEPITGMSIDLTVRFQINVQVSKLPLIFQFQDARDGLYPVFWAELSLRMDENMSNFLKRKVRMPELIAYSLLIALAIISVLLVFIAAVFLTFCQKKEESVILKGQNDKQPLYGSVHENLYTSSCVSNEKPTINIVSEEQKTVIQVSNEDVSSPKSISNGSPKS